MYGGGGDCLSIFELFVGIERRLTRTYDFSSIKLDGLCKATYIGYVGRYWVWHHALRPGKERRLAVPRNRLPGT